MPEKNDVNAFLAWLTGSAVIVSSMYLPSQCEGDQEDNDSRGPEPDQRYLIEPAARRVENDIAGAEFIPGGR